MCVTWLRHTMWCYVVRLHNETWLYHMCDMAHSYVRHDSLSCVTYVCGMVGGQVTWRDMTHSYVRHDSRNITDIHLCDSIWSTSLQLLTWLVPICVTWLMAPSLICAPWLIRMCVIWVGQHHCSCWHDSFIYAWRDSLTIIRTCAMTHSHVCHDSFTCVPWLIHTCVISLRRHDCSCWNW